MKELPTPTFDLSPVLRGLPAILRKPVQKFRSVHAWRSHTLDAALLAQPVMPVCLPASQDVLPAAIVPATGTQMPAKSGLDVRWARHLDEVREAQRLRYQVFAEEMGAQLSSDLAGHDIDLFDDYCEHLLVRDQQSGLVVGTYRVLTPAQARRVGST